jgi:hypothetical protein
VDGLTSGTSTRSGAACAASRPRLSSGRTWERRSRCTAPKARSAARALSRLTLPIVPWATLPARALPELRVARAPPPGQESPASFSRHPSLSGHWPSALSPISRCTESTRLPRDRDLTDVPSLLDLLHLSSSSNPRRRNSAWQVAQTSRLSAAHADCSSHLPLRRLFARLDDFAGPLQGGDRPREVRLVGGGTNSSGACRSHGHLPIRLRSRTAAAAVHAVAGNRASQRSIVIAQQLR